MQTENHNIVDSSAQKALIQALNWRYAVKRYDVNKKLDDETLNTLIEAMRLTPSSLGIQPWKFIIVSNKEVQARLKEAGFNQAQFSDASHIVVICAKNSVSSGDAERFLQSVAEQRGVTRQSLDGFAQNIFNFIKVIFLTRIFGETIIKFFSGIDASDWAEKQCYIALGNLITSAASIGVDANPMEGFNASKFDQILNLHGYHSVITCALGYRDAHNDFLATAKKVRYSTNEVFEFVK